MTAIRVAGVDEAGRGPLAGPVVAAAVVLPTSGFPSGIADSKRLSANARERLSAQIKDAAVAYAIAEASVEEIDELNILHATMLAMRRAVEMLDVVPSQVLVDGNRCPKLSVPARAIIKGDATNLSIGAASILAKVHRDALMIVMDSQFPGYGFARHKGYPTAAHLAALRELGACSEHRRSFAPVRRVLSGG
jgi:ribonuclease HII